MIMPFVDIPGQTDRLGAWGLGGLDPIEERVAVPGVSYIGWTEIIDSISQLQQHLQRYDVYRRPAV